VKLPLNSNTEKCELKHLSSFHIKVFQRLYVQNYAIHIHALITPWAQSPLVSNAFCECSISCVRSWLVSRCVCTA